MGMFDSVYVDCVCGARVEFQSKAGECNLDHYTINNVPPGIACDLIGKSEKCSECGATIALRGAIVLVREVTPNA